MWRGACETQPIFGLFLCNLHEIWRVGISFFPHDQHRVGWRRVSGALSPRSGAADARNADARPGLLSRGGGGPAVPCIDLRAWRGPSWRERSHHYSVVVIVVVVVVCEIKRTGD